MLAALRVWFIYLPLFTLCGAGISSLVSWDLQNWKSSLVSPKLRNSGLRPLGFLELFVLFLLKDPSEKKKFPIVVLLWSFIRELNHEEWGQIP